MGPAQKAEPLCGVPTRIDFAMRAFDKNVHLVRSLVDIAAIMWSLPRDVHDDAGLLLSEITANACRLYEGRDVRVWAAREAAGVLELAVWDPDPSRVPKMKTPDEQDESGRGLVLVAELSADWGWYACETTGGKVVWARLAW